MVEDQYWYRDDQQWYICESQPCPHHHLSFDWTQEEWAGFPAYRKTHPNQSQLIEARLNQPPQLWSQDLPDQQLLPREVSQAHNPPVAFLAKCLVEMSPLLNYPNLDHLVFHWA